MEGQQTIVLKNLPITTRNYTVVDTATGKPVESNTYSLTISPQVIAKLHELKKVNEEKKQQASFRNQYEGDSLTSAYTPTDNSVFTPLYRDEYIDARDVGARQSAFGQIEEESPMGVGLETMQSEGLLSRVRARDVEPEKKEIVPDTPKAPEADYITADTFQYNDTNTPSYSSDDTYSNTSEYRAVDNSVFTVESVNQTYEEPPIQVNRSEEENMEERQYEEKPVKEKKAKREPKKKADYIDLSPEEVKTGRGVAWMAYILFFIPLIFKGKNRFVRIHANEGLDLNIAEIIGAGLLLPFFLLENLTGIAETAVVACAILGAVVLCACAITLIPVIIGAMCGAQFQIPWLLKKRIIRVNKD